MSGGGCMDSAVEELIVMVSPSCSEVGGGMK